MQLTQENGQTLLLSSTQDLESALAAVGSDGNNFAVLARSAERYLQATGTRSSGFMIEYRDGSGVEHYCSTHQDIPHDNMVRTFISYYQGTDYWKTAAEWTRLHNQTTERAGPRTLVNRRNAVILLVAGALLFAGSLVQLDQTRDFDRNLGEATGTILALKREYLSGSSIPKLRVTVLFAADGNEYRVTDRIDHDVYSAKVGDRVHILYDRRNPAARFQFRDSNAEIWREYHFLEVTGALLAIAGVAFLLLA